MADVSFLGGNTKKQAEAWWLNKGQYYNQDKILYPKDAIMDAYMAGFDVGRIVGKSENETADPADRKSTATDQDGRTLELKHE